jgi:hypothetical protein
VDEEKPLIETLPQNKFELNFETEVAAAKFKILQKLGT